MQMTHRLRDLHVSVNPYDLIFVLYIDAYISSEGLIHIPFNKYNLRTCNETTVEFERKTFCVF